jgi:O-antigen ligase
MSEAMQQGKKTRFELALGSLIPVSVVAHIPSKLWVGAFDRNAAPQFVIVILMGIACAGYLFELKQVRVRSFVALMGLVLLGSTVISLLLSDNFFTGLIGDTGRFSGVASLWSLILLALVSSTFSPRQFFVVLKGIAIGSLAVTLLGALQAINLINLPTGGGVGSTFGNLDFLAASIGTTIILIYVASTSLKFSRIFFFAYLLLSILLLKNIDAKQGWLDMAIAAVLIMVFKLLHFFRFPELSARAWKALATFGLLLWSEAIFLIPMAKIHIPGISNDPNVIIRSDFWFAATQMFRSHFGFGVGPDNYGNYYEKYRSLSSVKSTETVLANDAHSSMLQTMGTLGVFASLAFLVLTLFVIYSFIESYKSTKSPVYLLLLLSFFIFYTNSLVSPIPLPLKAIFWVVAGFGIGSVNQTTLQRENSEVILNTRVVAGLLSVVLIFALSTFLPSYIKINNALAMNHIGKNVNYTVSDKLPCVVYAGAQLNLVDRSHGNTVKAANAILRNNPRCLDALGYLANVALHEKDYRSAKPYIYQLLDVAPARQSIVRLAAIYAMGADDEYLKNILTSQGIKLGLFAQDQIK